MYHDVSSKIGKIFKFRIKSKSTPRSTWLCLVAVYSNRMERREDETKKTKKNKSNSRNVSNRQLVARFFFSFSFFFHTLPLEPVVKFGFLIRGSPAITHTHTHTYDVRVPVCGVTLCVLSVYIDAIKVWRARHTLNTLFFSISILI